MILVNCKFEKLSSGYRTGKGQFSFQFQGRAMPKNVQITIQLHSFHMPGRVCSKSFKLGFSSMWTGLPDIHTGYRKGRGTRDQTAKIHWLMGKPRGFQIKNLLLLHRLCWSLWLCGSQKTGKFLEMGIPDHLTCLPRNLYAGQEATVRTGHGTTDFFKTGKWVCQGCILSPCLFNLYAEYIMWNARLDELQAGIKIARRNTNNHIYADDIYAT